MGSTSRITGRDQGLLVKNHLEAFAIATVGMILAAVLWYLLK
jgi:hypothetical protein